MACDVQRFIRSVMRKQGISRADLADRLGWYPSVLSKRLEQPTTTPKLNEIMDAVGIELRVGRKGISVDVRGKPCP